MLARVLSRFVKACILDEGICSMGLLEVVVSLGVRNYAHVENDTGKGVFGTDYIM